MEEEVQETQQLPDAESIVRVNEGITQPEAIEKLFTIGLNDEGLKADMTSIFQRVGWDKTPFAVLKPTRDLFLGRHDPFDEYQVIGDYEDSLILSKLHPALWGYALLLFTMAVSHSIITRSRGGFQQVNLRSYYAHTGISGEQGSAWGIKPMQGSKK